ncbi:hypothetical protein GF407_05905 [candidate division KSB1 bacterium]|nr:hypothetical protein [candidate division KSB1 bacterium]
MRLAYFILAYKNIPQVVQLLKAIYHSNHVYLIHIDKKSKASLEILTDYARNLQNVILMPRQNSWWGGISFVKLHLKAMHYLYAHYHWDYLINLSGQDLPLLSQIEIMDALSRFNAANYIEARPIKELWPDYRHRFDHYYLELPFFNYVKKVPVLNRRVKLPAYTTRLYAGSGYFILDRECCRYIFTLENLQEYLDFYRYTFIPEESVFQTILMNSKWRHTIIQDNKREINWKEGPEYPRIFRLEDLDKLTASTAFFARKFDSRIDSRIINRLIKRVDRS